MSEESGTGVEQQIKQFIDDIRHNSEIRSHPGFDTRTAAWIADQLEEILEETSDAE